MNYENDELYIKSREEYLILKDQLFNERETYNFIDKLEYDNWNKKQVIREYIKHLRQERDKYKSIVEEIREYIEKELIEINNHQYARGSRRLNKILEIIKELEEGNSNE